MDIYKALRELYDEKKRLDEAIERLERRLSGALRSPQTRRGRKTMGPGERQEVSRRMRAYWEARRRKKTNGSPNPNSGGPVS